MDEARRAQLFTCIDVALELVEYETHEDEPGWVDQEWWDKVNALAARDDGSLQATVRMLSRIAAASSVALSQSAGIPLEELLRRSRIALLDDVENRWS